MGSFLDPVNVSFEDGVYQPGAKAYFYQAGTSTPLDTYSDSGLSSVNANPVEANGSGQFGAIYMKRNQKYKVVLKDSDGNTIYTRDNVSAITLDEHVYLRLLQIASDPISQGATADGSTDDQTALQAAIDEAETNGTYVVDLLGKSYGCETQLTLHSGVKIINGTIAGGFRGEAEALILAQGTRGTAVNITSDVTIGDSQLTSASQTPALGRDSFCLLGDSTDWDESSTFTHGIMTRLSSASASTGTNVFLNERSPMGFASGAAAQIQPLTMLTDIHFEDVTFTDSTSQLYALIEINTCHRVSFKNCKFDYLGSYTADDGCLKIRACADVLIENCEWLNRFSSSGVGLFVGEASRDVTVRNCKFTGIPTAIRLGGPPGAFEGCVRDITIDGCEFQDCEVTHISGEAACLNTTIKNCRFADSGTTGPSAIYYAGANLRVKDCDFHHIPDYSIYYVPDMDLSTANVSAFGCYIEGNTIVGGAEVNESIQIEPPDGAQGLFEHCSIQDNRIINSRGMGIHLEPTGDVKYMIIARNHIINAADYPIYLEKGTTSVIGVLQLLDNVCIAETGGDYAAWIEATVTNFFMRGGFYERVSGGPVCVSLGTMTYCNVSDVHFKNGADAINGPTSPTLAFIHSCTYEGITGNLTTVSGGNWQAVNGVGDKTVVTLGDITVT